jgi:hypothetical protein
MPLRYSSSSALALAEFAVIIGLFAVFLTSFEMPSPVHGPGEIFGQDSVHILRMLSEGETYRWNPQNHLLYHVLLERGYAVWGSVFGDGLDSAFRYLKLFTALSGLAFLIVLRRLLWHLRLEAAQRIALLVLSGFSLSIWFHFSAFETHGLALPALALYLLCLVRIRDEEDRGVLDRVLLIASLLLMGWIRLDLFRFAVVTGLLLFLPRMRSQRSGVLVDLALVAVLGFAGNALLASIYLDAPLREAGTEAYQRSNTKRLNRALMRIENLTPSKLLVVGRTVSVYSLVMPVGPRDAERSWLAPPTNRIAAVPGSGRNQAIGASALFREPLHRALGSAISLSATGGVVLLLLAALGGSLGRVFAGDLLHALLLAQVAAGWVLYTWFNPVEPFLWALEFTPFWIVMIAELLRRAPRRAWGGIWALTTVIVVHNLCAFYLPLR